MPHQQKNRIVCGEVPDSMTHLFLVHMAELVRGVEAGSLTSMGMRRIVATEGYEIQVRYFLQTWLAEQQKKSLLPIQWECAMTTISRRYSLMKQTLASLERGGFSHISLYVDGPSPNASSFSPNVVRYRGDNIKTYCHWLLTLSEMFLRNSEADRYVIFQDDFVCCQNIRQYLEQCEYPSDGYLNLFTFMGNEHTYKRVGMLKNGKVIKKKEPVVYPSIGWHRSNQLGQGGLALVFDNNAVVDLLSQRHMYVRRWDHTRRDKFMDGAVVTAMGKAGRFEYIHNPSLIQHMGKESSMGNSEWGKDDLHPDSCTFPGEDFDALSFLPV